MPKDYLVCTLPCLGYFDTSYDCAVLSDQLSQYKPIPRPNFAPENRLGCVDGVEQRMEAVLAAQPLRGIRGILPNAGGMQPDGSLDTVL